MGEYSYTMTTSIVGTDDGRETYEIRRTFDVEGKSAVLIALYPTVSLLNLWRHGHQYVHLHG